MSSRYKALPLTFPFDPEEEVMWSDCVQEEDRIPLVFGRDGHYLDRYTGETWLEINGRAWLYRDRKDFEYELSVSQGNNCLEERIFSAAKTLLHTPLSSPALRDAYYAERDRRSLREAYRNTMKFMLRFRRWADEKGEE